MSRQFKGFIGFLVLAMLLTTMGTSALGDAAVSHTTAPFEKYDPAITVSSVLQIPADFAYPEGYTAEDNIYTRTYLDELGINIDYTWIAYSGEADDKIKMMISSDSLPDILRVNRQIFEMLVKADKLVDLTEAFEQCANDNFKRYLPEGSPARNAATMDGKLYGIPNHNDYRESANMVWVRTDWLKNLGLELPKTGDELVAVARAFTTQDPDQNGQNDTYGFGFVQDGIGDVYWNMFGSYPKIWIESDGKLVNGMFGDEKQVAATRNGLELLRTLYSEGVVGQEFATSNNDTIAQDIANGKFGIYFDGLWTAYWPLQGSVSADPAADWMPIPAPSFTGEPAKVSGEPTSLHQFHVVTKKCENPEALIQMLNVFDKYNNDPATADMERYNVDPVTNAYLTDLSPVGSFDPLFNLNTSARLKEALETNDPSKIASVDKVFYDQIQSYQAGENVELWCVDRSYGLGGSLSVCKYYADNNLNILNEYTAMSTEPMLEKQPILDKMWLETQSHVIMGADLSEYDNFAKGYMAAGGDVIAAEVNAAWKP